MRNFKEYRKIILKYANKCDPSSYKNKYSNNAGI